MTSNHNYHLMRRNGRNLWKYDAIEIIERSHSNEQLQNYDPEVEIEPGRYQATPRAHDKDWPVEVNPVKNLVVKNSYGLNLFNVTLLQFIMYNVTKGHSIITWYLFSWFKILSFPMYFLYIIFITGENCTYVKRVLYIKNLVIIVLLHLKIFPCHNSSMMRFYANCWFS